MSNTSSDFHTDSSACRSVAFRLRLALLLIAGLSGCASGPYGLVLSQRGKHTAPDDHDVLIIAVDGKMISTDQKRQKLSPGPHLLQMATTKRGFHGQLTYQPAALRVEPCMEYEFIARHDDRLSNRSWEAVLVAESPIEGCSPPAP